MTLSSFDTYIGNVSWSGGGSAYEFDGLLQGIRVYNRALSAAEIAAIYNAEK